MSRALAVLLFAAASLVLADAGPRTGAPAVRFDEASFGCPMHPDVRAAATGACPRCGMALLPMGPAGGPAYRVEVSSTPAKPKPGVAARWRFTVRHPSTGDVVKDFEIVHDMPFHLFVLSDDLEHYDHVHPEQEADGSFVLDLALPKTGNYSMFCDFLPQGGTPQVVRLRAASAGAKARAVPARAPLAADTSFSKVLDGVRFDLELVPSPPVAGRVTLLRYTLSDAATGAPIDDLEPYLGAWGHTLILSDDSTEYVHSHPSQGIPAYADRNTLRGGPEVAFAATIATPGRHRAWSQILRKGKVATVVFTFDVAVPQNLVRWDGSRWTTLGAGSGADAVDGPVHALAVAGTDLYAGGEFRTAGGAEARSIARWDGRRWRALGEGRDGPVRAIAVKGRDVYAGGEFPGGVARWDGGRWSTLGAGLGGDEVAVRAIAVVGEAVIVAGKFKTAGGLEANGIASWDGARWSPLGGGVRTGTFDGVVWALAQDGAGLLAGGQFLTAGDVVAHNVARWDGARWTALGGGLRGGVERVTSLAVHAGRIVAGGEFTLAGQLSVSHLAAWDGAAWTPLGIATSEGVRALCSGRALYVGGGAFSWPGGGAAAGVVRWDGTGWSGMGRGLDGGPFLAPVYAVAARGDAVYVGGGPFIVR